MSRAKRIAVLVLFFSTVLVVALEASARTETLRWTQHDPDGKVTEFHVYYGTEPGVYTSEIPVGIPPTDSDGAFYYDLTVPNATSIYVAVKAFAGSLESPYSNERLRLGIPGTPILVLD